MNNLNEIFGKEFDKLQTGANESFQELTASIANMQAIPAITDLEVCKQLEKSHFDIYINAVRLSHVSLSLSQMYHYIYLINSEVTKDNKTDNL